MAERKDKNVKIGTASENDAAQSVKAVKSPVSGTEADSVSKIPTAQVNTTDILESKKNAGRNHKPTIKGKSEPHISPEDMGDISAATEDGHASVQINIDAVLSPGLERATHFSLNDSAATEDSIGFMPYVRALSRLLCHRDTNTPLVVGVFGEWGSGKTTFMKLLMKEVRRLDSRPTTSRSRCNFSLSRYKHAVRQTWFNAWKHDVQSDLWVALLQAITTQVEGETPFIVLILRRFLRLLNWRFIWSVLIVATLIIGAFLYPEALASIASQQTGTQKASEVTAVLTVIFPPTILAGFLYWIGVFTPVIDFVRRLKTPLGLDIKELLHGKSLPDKIERFRVFEKELEIRLNDYLSENGRLIIYIDDLDRCSPEHAVEIIEAVNLFLETERCVFVLGMDNNLLANSIELKYKEISKMFADQQERGENKYGVFFLEKIIQIPISVPPMIPEEKERYVKTELLRELGSESEENTSATGALSPTKDHASENRLEDLDIQISEDTKNTFLTLLPYLGQNPRTIKRFYNMLTFVHFFYIANRHDLNNFDDISLTMWFFLQYKFPNEIKVLLKPDYHHMTFDQLVYGENGEFKKIKEFFEQYKSTKSNVDSVINRLKGDVALFLPATRFLAI